MATVTEHVSARRELSQMAQHLLPFAIRGLATLGVADALAAGPLEVTKIAEAVGADAEALYRTLRFTATRGVFRELPGRVFELTPPAHFMRSDVPGNVRAALMLDHNTKVQLEVFAEVDHTLRTGEPAYRKVMGITPFEAMIADASAVASFSEQMRQRSTLLAEPLLAAVDFSGSASVVDVGGGTGTLLAAILSRHPNITGRLLELPAVVALAPPVLDDWGVADRCELVPGDMFVAVPGGADTYLLASVIHDWPDADAAVILGNVRDAVSEGARVILVEMVIAEEGETAAHAAQLDFAMMISGGGRERTAAEFRQLLDGAGLALQEVRPVTPAFSALIATPAPRG